MRFAKNILPTGAGFTKTFGRFLGSETWAVIFNQPEVRHDDKLRSLLLVKGFNYEWILEEVLSSPRYNEVQRMAFNEAMKRAYEDMDSAIYERKIQNVSGRSCCHSFISRFAAVRDGRPFCFTLNQDLFIERFFSTNTFRITLPGLFSPTWFKDRIGATIAPEEHVTLSTETQMAALKDEFWYKKYTNFMYVKLHGSYRWKAHDGAMAMVVGQGKQGRIDKEPLLRWYLSWFKESVNEGDKNLVVIGYGFADEHINNIIADAVHDHGLRLFINSPQLPADF